MSQRLWDAQICVFNGPAEFPTEAAISVQKAADQADEAIFSWPRHLTKGARSRGRSGNARLRALLMLARRVQAPSGLVTGRALATYSQHKLGKP